MGGRASPNLVDDFFNEINNQALSAETAAQLNVPVTVSIVDSSNRVDRASNNAVTVGGAAGN